MLINNYSIIPEELTSRIQKAGIFIHDGYYIPDNKLPYNKIVVTYGFGPTNYTEFHYGFERIDGYWQFKALYVKLIEEVRWKIKNYYRKSFNDEAFEKLVRIENGLKEKRYTMKFLRKWGFERTSHISIFDIY
jgi:hypothetical protein